MTHTASLAGSAAAGSALLRRLGIIEVQTIAVFLETLKLLHAVGPLPGASIASVSCSGGEASLMADLSNTTQLDFADFAPVQRAALKAELGPIVTIANPLDYHTFIWGDTDRMTRVFSTVMEQTFDLTVFILDLPRADRCDPSSYQCAVDAIIAAKSRNSARVAVLASLSENMSEDFTSAFMKGGVAVLHGMAEGILAIEAAIAAGRLVEADPQPLLLAFPTGTTATILSEAASKEALSGFGLRTPRSIQARSIEELVEESAALSFPVVLKGTGWRTRVRRVWLPSILKMSRASSPPPGRCRLSLRSFWWRKWRSVALLRFLSESPGIRLVPFSSHWVLAACSPRYWAIR
jgi:acyl-CoA synthetase (NDP forming)